jgi:sodium transport system permease protein
MKIILTVIKKELKDTLRDRRTLFTALLLPAIVFPLMFMGMTKIETQRAEDELNKELNIGLLNAPDIAIDAFESDAKIKVRNLKDLKTANALVKADSLDAVIVFQADIAQRIETTKPGELTIYHKSIDAVTYPRLLEKISLLESKIVQQRMQKMDINAEVLTPFALKDVDVVSANEEMGATIGAIFPIIFIIFCFIGCMYPAIDLITGEKEKRTIETLLTVPSSRFEILIGKMATIALIGFLSAMLTIIGMFVGITYFSDSTQKIAGSFTEIISIKAVLLLFGMLIPLSVFFAGLLTAIVVRTKSFKESQSVVTPLTFIMVVPAILALSPEVKLNWQVVWIPVYNMAVAIEEIINGSISMAHYAAIILSLCVAAFIAAYISFKQFSNENMIVN